MNRGGGTVQVDLFYSQEPVQFIRRRRVLSHIQYLFETDELAKSSTVMDVMKRYRLPRGYLNTVKSLVQKRRQTKKDVKKLWFEYSRRKSIDQYIDDIPRMESHDDSDDEGLIPRLHFFHFC